MKKSSATPSPVKLKTVLLWCARQGTAQTAFTRQAAGLAFPSARVIDLNQLSDARHHFDVSHTLLILVDPAAEDVTQALAPTDAAGVPPMPTVAVSFTLEPEAGLEIIRPDFSLPWATHTLRNAVSWHRLQRENARLKGDMLTIGTRLSHDLRTPLGGINVTADLLKEVLADEKPDLVDMVKPIWASSEELSSMIRDIGLLARATCHSIPPSLLNMGVPVLAACERLERQVLQRGGSFIQPAQWPELLGVSPWLESIWWHLLSNALHHGAPSARIELGWEQAGEHYRFWVQNDGEGIAAKMQVNLFQPFDQLHHPGARRGLGLSIVQRLVELQGGCCAYETALEERPRFIFILPVSVNSAQ